MTSETSPGSSRARSSAPRIATLPNSWAGRLASEPLNAPTGVLVALAMTTVDWSVLILCSKVREVAGQMACAGASCSTTNGDMGPRARGDDSRSHFAPATRGAYNTAGRPAQADRRHPGGAQRTGLRCTVVVAYALQNGQPVKP